MKRRRKRQQVTKAEYQLIARVLVAELDKKTLKQIAGELGFSYQVVYKALREYVNVTKTLTLRFPE